MRTNLFTRILPELSSATPYFSLEAITKRLSEIKIEMADNTLRHYMSEAMGQGLIHDAGRGWYSRLREPCKLNPEPVAKIVRQLEKEFPLLDFACWSTQQINPWMHHILSKFLAFVNVDKDGLIAVSEFLRDAGYEVFSNPTGTRVSEVRPNGKSVVIRPLHVHEPKAGHYAPPEAILVDLCVENRALSILDKTDLKEMAQQLASENRLCWASLVHYADKRRIGLEEIFSEVNTLSAQ